MGNTNIIELQSILENKLNLSSGEYFVKDLKNLELNILEGANVSLLVNGVDEDSTLSIQLNKDAFLHLAFLSSNNFKTFKLNGKTLKNSQILVYFADFSFDKNFGDINIHLLEEGSNCEWHLASLSSKNDNKQFDVSVYHDAPNTFARMDNYGVCKDDAKLVFSGVSSIVKGSHSSKTHQNAKIMVFDEHSVATAKPILKIDEHDIEASHAAVVGKINDDHLFYLTSRGLTEAQAKQLITYGYLKPILNGFNDEKIKDEINSLIEERM